jgi:ATP-dependent Clp protease ATP-binding subunit ClpA
VVFETGDVVTATMQQAFDEAMRLGHGWVGPEHILLALLSTPSVASEVLAERGIAYEEIAESEGRREGIPRYDPAKGLSGPNPDGAMVKGRAEGFVLAAGSDRPEPEHWLLSLVYSGKGMGFPTRLQVFDVSAADILDGLRRRGVRTPEVDPVEYNTEYRP